MTVTPTACPGPDLLLLLAHGLLEGDEEAGLTAHVDGCATCQKHRASLEDAMQPPPQAEPPAEVLTALRERIAEHEAHVAAVSNDVQVSLLCTYCKDDLPAPETIYCASCVAPHHEDCFYEHGLCAAAGCEGRRIVRSAAAPERPQQKPRSGGRNGLLIVLGIALGGGAVAALYPGDAAAPPVDLPVVEKKAETQEEPSEPKEPDAPEGPDQPDQPDRLDLTDLVGVGDDPNQDDEWKREYRQILQSRTVTLNFPNTPMEEVISFLQDITGLNIVVSSDVKLEEMTVSMRLRDVLLADALAVILELSNLSAELYNEALVILPRKQETLEEQLERIAKDGIAPPAAAFEVRKRLQSQQITMNFDQTPLTEAVDFMRDITGLNYVLKVKDPDSTTVSVRVRNVSLFNALQLMLKGTGLGLRLTGSGIVWIVPKAEASEGIERTLEKRDLLAKRCRGEVLRDGRLTDLEARLKASLGDAAHTTISRKARRSTCRLILPAELTVGEALGLAKTQASLTYAVAWLGNKPILALDAPDEHGFLAASEELCTAKLPETSHQPILDAWTKGQAAHVQAFKDLNSVAWGKVQHDDLRKALSTLEATDSRLRALSKLSWALRPGQPPRMRKAYDATSRVLASFLNKEKEIRETTVVHDAKSRAGEGIVKNIEASLRSLEAEYGRASKPLITNIENLNDEIAAIPESGRVDTRVRLTELRKSVTKLEDEALELARTFDLEKKELQDQLQDQLDELARQNRDHALQIARLESERGMLLGKAQDLLSGSYLYEELKQVSAALESTGAHPALDDYTAWRAGASARAKSAAGRSAEVFGKLGLSVETRKLEKGLWIASVKPDAPAAQAGLQKGDRLDGVDDHFELFMRLGKAEKQLELSIERDGKVRAVTVQVE